MYLVWPDGSSYAPLCTRGNCHFRRSLYDSQNRCARVCVLKFELGFRQITRVLWEIRCTLAAWFLRDFSGYIYFGDKEYLILRINRGRKFREVEHFQALREFSNSLIPRGWSARTSNKPAKLIVPLLMQMRMPSCRGEAADLFAKFKGFPCWLLFFFSRKKIADPGAVGSRVSREFVGIARDPRNSRHGYTYTSRSRIPRNSMPLVIR